MHHYRFVRILTVFTLFFLGIFLFIWLIEKQGIEEIIPSIAQFGIWPFVGFVFLSLLNFVFYSLRWQLIVNHHAPKKGQFSLWRIYQHRMAGFSASYLTPAAQVGGEPVRIAMLASDGMSVKKATSSVLLDIAFEMAAYILFIIAGISLALWQGFGGGQSLVIVSIGLMILLILLGAFFYAMAKGWSFIAPLWRLFRLNRIKKWRNIESNIRETEKMMTKFLAGKKKSVIIVTILSVLVISFRVLEVFYLAYFFGMNLNFAQAFLVSTLPGIALILPVPAGLGIFEGSFAAIFGILAIPLNAIAFAFIIRGRDLVFIVFGFLHMMRQGAEFLFTYLFRQPIEEADISP